MGSAHALNLHVKLTCVLIFLCFSFDVSDEPFVRGAEFWQVHDLLMK